MKNGAEVAEMLADFVNNVCYDQQGFVEEVTLRTHRTLQQNLMGLFLKVIKAWSELDANGFDLRNQATVELSKKIAEAFPEEVKYGLPYI